MLAFTACICLIIGLGGCADYVPEKATELQARSILNNLSRIQPVPDPNIPVPEVYKAPPKIIEQNVGGEIEYKLFYFCKYHTADKLQAVVRDQFASTLFGKQGQKTTMKDYTVSGNPATNQLIVRAPSAEDIQSVLELLEASDVPPIQVKIDCIISELYADLTMDKEVTLLIENLFGENIVMGGKQEKGKLLPAFPGAALRDPARDKFGLKVGFGSQIGIAGHEFRALIDLLVSRGYLKILMNPTLEVVNGETAKIETKEHVPLQEVFIRGTLEGFLETRTEYYDVIDSLQITPHVFADGYIGMQTDAKISAKLTPEGITQQPIVTERTITNKENRIRHGESLIIGGIRKSEKRDVIRGVPFLKDIPLVGALFSGRDFEERAKEIIFILTPTISTGGMPNKEMVDRIRDMHEPPIPYEQLHRAILDPFGLDSRERERQRQLLEAEEARIQAIAEKERARRQVREADRMVDEARSEADRAMTELTRIRAETARIKAEADLLAAQAAKDKAEAEKARAEAEKKEANGGNSEPQEEDSANEQPEQEQNTQSGKQSEETSDSVSAPSDKAENSSQPQANAAEPSDNTTKTAPETAEQVTEKQDEPAETVQNAAKGPDDQTSEPDSKEDESAETAAQPEHNTEQSTGDGGETENQQSEDPEPAPTAKQIDEPAEDSENAAPKPGEQNVVEAANNTPTENAQTTAEQADRTNITQTTDTTALKPQIKGFVKEDGGKITDSAPADAVPPVKTGDSDDTSDATGKKPVHRRFWYDMLGASAWIWDSPDKPENKKPTELAEDEAAESDNRAADPNEIVKPVVLQPIMRQFKGN